MQYDDALPEETARAIASYPEAAKVRFTSLRDLIFQTAADHADIGPLTESLKWGEPSYAPKRARTGTAVRIAWKEKAPETISLFVNCQTSLVSDWRDLYQNELDLIGNRELRLPLDKSLPEAPLRHCVAMALTYFR